MATKKEYLVELGLISGKAGRWPRAAHEAIAAAEAKGMTFDELSNAEIAEQQEKEEKAKARAEAAAERAERPKATDVVQAADPRPDRPKGYYTFRNPDRTTFKRLHTVACQLCSYSLMWCYCPEGPVVQAYPWRGAEAYAKLAKVPVAVITSPEVPEKPPTRGGRRSSGTRPTRRRSAA